MLSDTGQKTRSPASVGSHCMLVFLRMHALVLHADPFEAKQVMLDLAAGRVSEADIHAWLLTRVTRL